MKKFLFYALLLLFVGPSCKKSSPTTGGNNNNDTIPDPNDTVPTPTVQKFMSFTSGSTWNYQTVNNDSVADVTNYTLTCSNIDTTIGSRSYRIFYATDTSGSTEEFYNNTGSDYFQYAQLSDLLPEIDLKYLNDSLPINSSWISDNITVSITNPIAINVTAKIKNTIIEKGGSIVVNGNNYTNTIKVQTELINISDNNMFVDILPQTQQIFNIYAPKYGRIKSDFKLKIVATIQLNPNPIEVINTNTTTTLVSSQIL